MSHYLCFLRHLMSYEDYAYTIFLSEVLVKLDNFWKDHQILDYVLHPVDLPYSSDDELLSTQQFRINIEASEPIQIPKRKPRRRLYSGGSISEEEELHGGDSGFDSPAHISKACNDTAVNVEDTIQEEQENGSNTKLNLDSSVFIFDDETNHEYRNGAASSHPNLACNRVPQVEPLCTSYTHSSHQEEWYRPLSHGLHLDIIPHQRITSIKSGHSSRQVSALCSPNTHSLTQAPTRYTRQRSYSHNSYGSSSCSFYSRDRTASNISLLSFGRGGDWSSRRESFLTQNDSILSSTPRHEYRQRSVSDASAPPLPEEYYDQIIKGYENMSQYNPGAMIPPPSPLDYSLNYYIHFTDEPPPPYQEEDTRRGHVEEEKPEDDCRIKDRSNSVQDSTDATSRLDDDWLLPNDNHTYNPQFLQGMEIRPIPEYEPFRNLSEDDAIEALSKFVSNNWCYNTGVAKQMKTKEIRPTYGHQYVLETFYEERSMMLHQEPYTCQLIDSVENGQPPNAWDIVVPRPRMFQQRDVHVEVPHTASIKDCSSCCGKGSRNCSTCHGTGEMKCVDCDGLGVIHNYMQEELSGLERRTSTVGCSRSCRNCNGGKKLCFYCSGKGQRDCKTCCASGHVKVFLQLTVKWKVKRAQKVLNTGKLPDKCITRASGTLVFQEQNDRVYPLLDFHEDEINLNSKRLINRHENEVKNGRIIMQRHCVREVPIAEISSQWKRQEFTYWVYGNENQVYFPDYPSRCFSCCSIL